MSSSIDTKKGGPPAYDETTPLLVTSQAGPTAQSNEESSLLPNNPSSDDDDDKPLPLGQIFVLCYARLVEPIAFFSIFPFINKMIEQTGNVAMEDVGFYSGLIESLFSLTQMCMMITWGRAADRIGRKPVLIFSLVGMAIATALFGFSKTLWQMIMFRCLAGVFSGSVVTLRAMISENSTKKTQARAFSYFAFTSNCGIFLGPFIGGILSDPARQYKSVFGGVQFFKDYPFALPTIITGAIGITAAVVCVFFLNETLTPDRKTANKDSPHALISTWDLFKLPGVAPVIYIYGHTMLLAFAYTAVAPVFWYTSVEQGGFGFSELEIALFLALAGASQSIWTLLVFPPLQHRVGTGGILRICAVAWPIFFFANPFGNLFLRKGWNAAFWAIVPAGNAFGAGCSMAFTGVQLALNDISPSHSTLGTINALALAVTAGLRSIAPALFTSLFATGISKHVLSGYLIWVILIPVAATLNITLRWLPEKAEGKIKPNTNEE